MALPKGLKSGDLFVVSIPAADEETREPELPYWSLIVDNHNILVTYAHVRCKAYQRL